MVVEKEFPQDFWPGKSNSGNMKDVCIFSQ